jgi:hypothetical protein
MRGIGQEVGLPVALLLLLLFNLVFPHQYPGSLTLSLWIPFFVQQIFKVSRLPSFLFLLTLQDDVMFLMNQFVVLINNRYGLHPPPGPWFVSFSMMDARLVCWYESL